MGIPSQNLTGLVFAFERRARRDRRAAKGCRRNSDRRKLEAACLRHARKLSQEQLAHDAEVDRAYMSRVERAATYVGLGIIGKLATILEVEWAELFRRPHLSGSFVSRATSDSEKISFNQINKKTGHRIKYVKVDADMLDLAKHIVNQRTFEPEKFEDHYKEALTELINAKRNGRTIAAKPRPRGENVVDLMDALKKSIASEAPKARSRSHGKLPRARRKFSCLLKGKAALRKRPRRQIVRRGAGRRDDPSWRFRMRRAHCKSSIRGLDKGDAF
jgi:transcriptional regulator with XRE-family HTH domain